MSQLLGKTGLESQLECVVDNSFLVNLYQLPSMNHTGGWFFYIFNTWLDHFDINHFISLNHWISLGLITLYLPLFGVVISILQDRQHQ